MPACHTHRDCPASDCCHRDTGRCVARTHTDARGCHLPVEINDGYPKVWAMQPGDKGFSAYTQRLLTDAHIAHTMSCNHADPKDNWHQLVLSYLVHPRSPITRLLVCWQLGTGKTIGMLRVLDNHFDDPRPKVLVFPTRALVANFYEELARRPNRYRQWATDRMPPNAPALDADALRRMLEYGTARSPLAGPLRAFSYSQVGGCAFEAYVDTKRQRAITAAIRARQPGVGSPLDGTIVLCDEAHNILYPSNAWTAVQKKLVEAFRDRLYRAREAVVVLFTATPVLHQAADVRAMLNLVKGHKRSINPACGDEGFVSWYMERPQPLFARLDPPGVERDLRKAIVSVFLDGHPDFWQAYVHRRYGSDTHKRRAGAPAAAPPTKRGKTTTKTKPAHAATTFNHACVVGSAPCPRTLARYENLVYGQTRDEANVKHDNAAQTAPKLDAIAASIAEHNLRTVVLIHRENGCQALLRLLREHGLHPIFLDRVTGASARITHQRERENREAIQRFNQGVVPTDADRVLVATAEEYSEGVSFMNVRRIILADLSPGTERPSWSLVKQRIGRALRACSHEALPPELRTVWISLFVAKHRQPGLFQTVDEEKLDVVLSEMDTIEGAMDTLRAVSVDASYFASTEVPHAGPERQKTPWERLMNLFTATKTRLLRKKANNTS